MGWGVYLLCLLVYTLTVDPTVSFWDSVSIFSHRKIADSPSSGSTFVPDDRCVFGPNWPGSWTIGQNGKLHVRSLIGYYHSFYFWTITNLAKKLVAENVAFTDRQV